VEVNSYLSISKISVTIQFQNFDEGFNKIIDKLGFPHLILKTILALQKKVRN